jgi:hypothetical protein
MDSRPSRKSCDLRQRGVPFLAKQTEFGRDEVASTLLHYGDRNGTEWADIIDLLTMYPDARRRVVRILGEIDATT